MTKLREQVARIAAGEYSPGEPVFTRGPAGMGELSQDLNALAHTLAKREIVHQALVHEVHHRVKNNLQIVTSLLSMQVNAARQPAVREAMGRTRARMGALALIHRMLYEQSDIGSENVIDIARLMTELCAQLRLWNRDRTDIEFAFDVSADAVPLDSAMPLALFTVEVIMNAYAHAFAEGRTGKVVLNYSVSASGAALLSIADDGVGFDGGSDSGLMGFLLIRGLAHQLGGKVDIASKIGAGTQVRLEYPVAG